MPDKKQKNEPDTQVLPETDPANFPEREITKEEILDTIPDDESADTPGYEPPEPGEGP